MGIGYLMSRGEYISLEGARERGVMDRFAKEHPSEGDHMRFDRLLAKMSKTTEEVAETSSQAHDVSSNETQTRQDT
jgi:hypothetical protein